MIRRKDPFEKTYTDIRYRVAIHIVFWLLFAASVYYFNTISFNAVKGTPGTYLLAIKNTITFAVAFYLLMYWIVPCFFQKRKWIQGGFLFILWVVFIAVLDSWGDILILNNCEPCMNRFAASIPDYYQFLQRSFPSIVFIRVVTGGLLYHLIIQLSLPIAIKIGRSYFRQAVQQLQLAKDNLQLEFNFLKSQVNPHFLFNTLNNIYALVVAQRNEQAAATLARLSGFMRYTLYETGDEKILLEKEVQLLKDYIELEKLRLNETRVALQFESDNAAYTIPPLLFMPALENAFKYTTDKAGSKIITNIKANGGLLQVTIENSFDTKQEGPVGGIGLQNMQRRLQHYFGNKARYAASAGNGVYLFQLSFPLT
ncbi:sensor histidine kinase [Flavisolibacter sp. BT320]|nr:sensor histidine kinase [Flavisolibacter longurius]